MTELDAEENRLFYELTTEQWEHFHHQIMAEREPTEVMKEAAIRYRLLVRSK